MDEHMQTATPASSPADERVAALEARLSQLQNALLTVAQRDEVRSREQTVAHERAEIDRQVSEAAARVDAAQRKLAEAYEAGEAVAIARATAELSAATTESTAAKMQQTAFVARARQQAAQPQQPPAQPQQQRVDDTNLRQWRERNANWYGIDPEMTEAALGADREIRNQGVLEVGSQAYFQAIDARLRARFPDRMPQSAATASAQFQQQRAPAAMQASGGETRIPADVAESYRRMGFDTSNPDVVKRLVNARAVAVQKGLLPEKPTGGRIVER